jgi:hypothetical protein
MDTSVTGTNYQAHGLWQLRDYMNVARFTDEVVKVTDNLNGYNAYWLGQT